MRLIDADALTDVIEKTDWYHLSEIGAMVSGAVSGDNAWFRESDIFKALDEAPTIDAAPVVRCKDCKHGARSNAWDEWWFCAVNVIHHSGDNFCSYGERRGDTDG